MGIGGGGGEAVYSCLGATGSVASVCSRLVEMARLVFCVASGAHGFVGKLVWTLPFGNFIG